MSGDFIDYTALQKRGILKKIKPEIEEKNEYASFIPKQDSQKVPSLFTEPITPAFPQNSPQENPFSFLDSLASPPQTEQTNEPKKSSSLDLSDISVKIENLEYKIERFMERLAHVEDKIEKFREKVG